MAVHKSGAPSRELPKTNVLKSPTKDQVRSGARENTRG